MTTSERIEKLSRSESIAFLLRSVSVSASDSDAFAQASAKISRIENAPARELCIFAGAIVTAQRRARARFVNAVNAIAIAS